MSRFGTARPPAAVGEPGVAHAWAVVCGHSGAIEAFVALEDQVEQVALAMGAVVVDSPTYETFHPADAGVPPGVREIVRESLAAGVGGLWAVHGWARVQVRGGQRAAATTAVPLPELAAASGGP